MPVTTDPYQVGASLTNVLQRQNPYVGPRAFREDESELFFGREWETNELYNLLVANRVLLLYSPSGAGKSSLVEAGLRPRLRQEGFHVLPTVRLSFDAPGASMDGSGHETGHESGQPTYNRYTHSALLSLQHDLPEEGQNIGLTDTQLAGLTLDEYLKKLTTGWEETQKQVPKRVLIFDQLEEVLTTHLADLAGKREFFDQVGVALEDSRLYALFVLREDHLAALGPYQMYLPTHLRNTFRLDFLGKPAARRAIQLPLGKLQPPVQLLDSATEALLENLSQVLEPSVKQGLRKVPGPYIEPVQLQVVCFRLYEKLKLAEHPEIQQIEEQDLAEAGDVDKALAEFYAEEVRRIANNQDYREYRLRDWIEKHLISSSGARTSVIREAERSAGLENTSLDALVDAHLARLEKRRGFDWYELAHDRLVEPVLEDNRKFRDARKRRQLVQAAIASGLLLVLVLLFGISLLSQWRADQNAQQTKAMVTLTWAADQVLQADTQKNDAFATLTQVADKVLQADEQKIAAIATLTQAADKVLQADQQKDLAVANRDIALADSRATATQAALALLPVDQLEMMSTSPQPEERVAAIQALLAATLVNPDLATRSVPVLIARLQESESDAAVRLTASMAMLQIADRTPSALAPVVADLTSAAGDSDPEVRGNIARLLGEAATIIIEPGQLTQVEATLNRLSADPDPTVQIAAREGQSNLEAVSIRAFVGNWENVDPETRGWTRLEVSQVNNALNFHIFGKCHPTDCDAGEALVPFTGGTLVFPLDHDFAQITFTVTLETDSDQLMVETFTRFIDNSGRSDYLASDRFARHLAVIATPTLSARPLPDDQLLVALFWEDKGLAMIDRNTNQVVKTVVFPSINARFLSVNSAREEVYVSFSNGDTFYIVSSRTGEIIGRVVEEVGWNSDRSVVSSDGSLVYLATSGGPEGKAENKVLVIDPVKQQVTKVLRLGPYKFPLGLEGIELSADGRTLYTLDATAKELLAINTTTGEVINHYQVTGGQLLDISPDGNALYLADEEGIFKFQIGTWTELWKLRTGGNILAGIAGEQEIYLLDSDGNRVLRVNAETGGKFEAIKVNSPGGAALSPDGNQLFVSSTDENIILIIDLQTGEPIDKIPIISGKGPTDLVILSPP
jgi:DNA-binding beta-propeller fold protein YncE